VAGALLVPVLFLALLELGLRAIGFGGSGQLFVDYPDLPGYQRVDPELMRRYVETCGAPAARVPSFLFEHEKRPGALRLVVQGASTAAGFPYGRWGGLAGMLGDRLEAERPAAHDEVVSTALAAVTSYTLRDLASEIVAAEPDAVLIYAGHNEYVGVLGAGSALTAGTSRAAARMRLALGRSRVYRLVERAVACGREAVATAGGGDRTTLFARAARGARAPLGSAVYEAGLAQFDENVGALLDTYRRAGVPVYIATVVSNEKDLPPLSGGPAEGVDTRVWREAREAGARALAAGDLEGARGAAQTLLSLDDEAADAWFVLGQVELRAGRADAARAAFVRARDLDALRFRAPSAINDRVRALAARYGARLVDVEQRFAAASPDGIVGHELLLEHVHPNADGYFLLADAFYDALAEDGLLGMRPDASTREAARRDMPLTELDRVLAGYDVMELEAGYPFSDPPRPVALPPPATEIERIARLRRDGAIGWMESMERSMQLYRREGRIEDAARIARLAAQEYPADHGPNLVAGLLLLEAHHPARARLYLERSHRAAPEDARALAALLHADRSLGDRPGAVTHAEALRRVRADAPASVRATLGGAAAAP